MAMKRLSAILVIFAVAAALAYFLWRSSRDAGEREKGLELAAKGDFAQAEPLLRKSLERNPSDVESLKALATHFARANEPDQALPLLVRWEKLEPKQPEPIATRFRMWMRLRDFESAIPDAERLSKMDAIDTDLHLHVSNTLIRASRLDEAERTTRAGIAASSDNANLRVQLSEILLARSDWPAARQTLDALLRVAPQHARAWKTLGLVLSAQGEAEQAIPTFERSLALDSNDASARYHLALALKSAGRLEESQREMARYEKQRVALDLATQSVNQPEKNDLALRAVHACMEAGLPAQAQSLLRQILANDPKHAEAERLLNAFGK